MFVAPVVRHLGISDYEHCWYAMRAFTDHRTDKTADELWVVEHPPVFTQGQAGKPEHILQHSSIPLVKTDRGGQVTYHGPGQLVIYLLIDLKRLNIAVRDFVSLMENTIIATLESYSITAGLKEGAPGVYVRGAKIASLGLRVRKGCTYHGLSLNVDMDLAPFRQINPCGYPGLEMTQLSDLLGHPVAMDEVEARLLPRLLQSLQAASLRGS